MANFKRYPSVECPICGERMLVGVSVDEGGKVQIERKRRCPNCGAKIAARYRMVPQLYIEAKAEES